MAVLARNFLLLYIGAVNIMVSLGSNEADLEKIKFLENKVAGLENDMRNLKIQVGQAGGRPFRDVDAAMKWMNEAEREGTVVPAMGAAIVAEIKAQAHQMATLEAEISRRGDMIRKQKQEIEALTEENAQISGTIDRMKQIVKELGIKAKVVQMLKEEF